MFLLTLFMKKRSKKDKVTEFVSMTPGFAEMFPIIKAEKYKRDWIDECGKDILEYNAAVKSCPISKLKDASMSRGRSIARCPGIRSFMRAGYLIPLPCDVIIETYGDGEKFEAAALTPNINNMFNVVNQNGTELHKYSAFPPNTLKSVIKLGMSWNVIPSEDFVYIIMNPFYNNEPRFTSLPGIIDPYYDTQINIFLLWHILQGRETIKAGSIVAQLIPIPRNIVTPELVCRSANIQDREKFMKAANILPLTEIRDLSNVSKAMKTIFNS